VGLTDKPEVGRRIWHVLPFVIRAGFARPARPPRGVSEILGSDWSFLNDRAGKPLNGGRHCGDIAWVLLAEPWRRQHPQQERRRRRAASPRYGLFPAGDHRRTSAGASARTAGRGGSARVIVVNVRGGGRAEAALWRGRTPRHSWLELQFHLTTIIGAVASWTTNAFARWFGAGAGRVRVGAVRGVPNGKDASASWWPRASAGRGHHGRETPAWAATPTSPRLGVVPAPRARTWWTAFGRRRGHHPACSAARWTP